MIRSSKMIPLNLLIQARYPTDLLVGKLSEVIQEVQKEVENQKIPISMAIQRTTVILTVETYTPEEQ